MIDWTKKMRRIWDAFSDYLENFRRWKKWSRAAGIDRSEVPMITTEHAISFAIESEGQIDVFGAALHPRRHALVRSLLAHQLGAVFALEDLSRSAHKLQPFARFKITGEGDTSGLKEWLQSKGCSVCKPELGSGRVAMATLFQQGLNELMPWLDHYRLLGVDFFLLAYNGHPPAELTDVLIEQADVRLIHWDLPYSYCGRAWGRRDLHYAQPPFLQWAYRWCELSGYDRILTCDIDEFVLSTPKEFKELMNSQYDEVVFENVWAKTESSDGQIDLDEKIAVAERAIPRVFRGKTAKRVGVFHAVDVHYTSDEAAFGGWFLHFAHQTGGVFRPESEFHWTQPLHIQELLELLPTLDLPIRGKSIDC